ncbi:hypothetical protein D3C85_1080360 [compost metagenome]
MRRLFGQAATVEIGAAHRKEHIVEQPFHVQARVVAIAHAQRDVHFLIGEIDQRVR